MLIRRFIFTFFCIVVYRLGVYVPNPGVNINVLNKILQEQAKNFFLEHALTGGIFNRISIFTLNIIPYITSSIIVQLILLTYRSSNRNKKKINNKRVFLLTRFLCVLFSFIQGYGIISSIEFLEYKGEKLFILNNRLFKIFIVFNLMIGSIIIIFLAEQITNKGVGNGNSIMIYSNIVSSLFPSFILFFKKSSSFLYSSLISFFIFFLTLFIIIFFEGSRRKLLIFYHHNLMNKNQFYINKDIFLPIKINLSGAIPSLFAHTFLFFPSAVSEFFFGDNIIKFFSSEKIFILLYLVLVFIFCFVYNIVIFNSENLSQSLKKNDIVVVNHLPGIDTAKYFKYIIKRISLIGSLYVSFICFISEAFSYKFRFIIYFNGTTLLIITSVILEINSQAISYLLNLTYFNNK